MAKTLSAASIIDFASKVKHSFQGRERLEGTTEERRGVVGESSKFPVMGKGAAKKRTAPQVKLELMNVTHSRVTATLEDFNASEMTDIFDQAEVNYDEKMQLAKTIARGIGRRKDQIKLDALIAGVTDGTVTKSVPATLVGGTDGLNLQRLLKAKALLGKDEADEGTLHFACHANNVEQALATTEFGSADFNSLRALMDGDMQKAKFGGFIFHVLGDRGVEGGLGLSASIRQGFAWHEESTGIASANLQEFDISWLPDYASWICSGFLKSGGVVIDPLGVVEVLMDES